MQETINNCARAEDLIAYIYKEATTLEARDFEKHARQCSSCHAELAAFGNVREAINDWRQHSLGGVASPAYETGRTHAFAQAGEGRSRRRSALAAWREFFTLSPMWMRAATAVAALLFCALVVIAIAYFTEQPKVIVERQNTPLRPRENIIEQGKDVSDQKSNQGTVTEKAQPQPQQEVIADTLNDKKSRAQRDKPAASASRQFAKQRRQTPTPSLNERSIELASADDYLPFTSSSDEERLPSLADLANDDDN